MLRSQLRLCLAMVFATGVFGLGAWTEAQEAQSAQSVAEAAARAKEAKKKASAKSKVLTEDDLAGKGAKAGEAGAANAQAEAGMSAATPAGAPDTAKEKPGAKKEDDPEVIRMKEQLAEAEKDLDLAKREASLAQDSYYSNPD